VLDIRVPVESGGRRSGPQPLDLLLTGALGFNKNVRLSLGYEIVEIV
jgi:hypothetical protein